MERNALGKSLVLAVVTRKGNLNRQLSFLFPLLSILLSPGPQAIPAIAAAVRASEARELPSSVIRGVRIPKGNKLPLPFLSLSSQFMGAIVRSTHPCFQDGRPQITTTKIQNSQTPKNPNTHTHTHTLRELESTRTWQKGNTLESS
jgi:hypothetical protein